MGDDAILAWLNVMQVHAVVHVALNRRLTEAVDLSLAEMEVLWRLDRAPEKSLRMAELASVLLVAKSGATRTVARLVERGFVEREYPSEDRRAVCAHLTSAGHELYLAGQPVFAAAVEEHFGAALGGRDIAELRRICRRVLESEDAWEEERCELPDENCWDDVETESAAPSALD